ncbi:cuticle protein 79-like [Triticum dicoccoides]|uniref:cuticle protein 79-like n=1 Tax=Triticum dicoccoides TaxID=85692 RepID=UPI00188EB971|nr:cuticle protein 79-like [Triticum dicoccoides]
MASTRAVAIVFSLLILAAAAPSPLVRARMVPADGEGVPPAGRIAAPEVTGSVGTASSLQEALVQRPPLPLPLLTSPPAMTVYAQRSSRMLGSVPSPGVGH